MTADVHIWWLVRACLVLCVVLAVAGILTPRKWISDTLVNLSILSGVAGFAMFLVIAATGAS